MVLAVYIAVSLSIGSILGLAVKNQAKLSMVSQLVFLPSIMLSGIMFPANLLPEAFEAAGKVFLPAGATGLCRKRNLYLEICGILYCCFVQQQLYAG